MAITVIERIRTQRVAAAAGAPTSFGLGASLRAAATAGCVRRSGSGREATER